LHERSLPDIKRGDEGYADIVGGWFLEPFGLHDKEKFFTFHEASRNAAIKRNHENGVAKHFLKSNDFYLARPFRPYLVVNATLIASDKKDAAKEKAYYPVEITPIWVFR
jgi:hypothetical protein